MGQMLLGYRLLVAVGAMASALAAASLSAEEQTTASVAASAKPKAYAAANAAAERIESALDQKLKAPISEVQAPLNQILQVLADDYEIPVLFDKSALDAVAASPEVEVSIDIANVSLRSALDLILQNAGEDLTYIIDKEVLLITTQEEAEKRLEVRVYVVNDLVRRNSSLVWSDEMEFDELMDAIVSTVETDSWMENGTGEGEIQPLSPGMLVVAQTRRVHEQIGDLLQQIREAKSEISTGASEQQTAAANRPVLRSIAFSDEAMAKCEETRNQLSEVIKKSVNWDREAEGGDLVLQVLPNRVLVRHVPEVVEEVALVVQHVFPATQVFHCTGGGGGLGGAAGGATGSAGVASSTPAASAPELAEPPAGGENGGQRPSSARGGF